MRHIELTCGFMAIVDDDDIERSLQLKWCYIEKRKGHLGYAIAYTGGGRANPQYVTMQNFIMGPPPTGYTWDHINLDSLDNRKSNLRLATDSQQTVNRGPRSDNTSGVSGVYWDKANEMWRPYTDKDGKRYWGKRTTSFEDAVKQRNQLVFKHHDQFARIFGVTDSSPLSDVRGVSSASLLGQQHSDSAQDSGPQPECSADEIDGLLE